MKSARARRVTTGSRWPDLSCRVMATLPVKMIVRPWPTSPALASASPAAKDRTTPNRRNRSISDGSKVGNIWCRRVSMIDFAGSDIFMRALLKQ